MGRRSKDGILTPKERRLVRFRAKGHSIRAAGKLAGYSEGGASHVIRRPLVQSALSDALRRQGVTLAKMVKPIKDALQAKRVILFQGTATETALPDHQTRLEASDRAVALLGGMPRQVEMPPPPREPLTVIFEADGQHTMTAIRLGCAREPKTKAQADQDTRTRVILDPPDVPDPLGPDAAPSTR